MDLTAFQLVAICAIAVMAALLSLVLFEPPLDYRVCGGLPAPESREFLGLVAALVDAPVLTHSRTEVLLDGESFYDAELKAIAGARRSVHVECYVFHPSPIARRFIETLADRARNGVRVRIVLDAIGSINLSNRYLEPLRAAGGEVQWYQPVRWRTLKRFNNRTHRELIVVDGEVGFVGGAGIGSWWTDGRRSSPPWRDTMVRVEGPLATALQTCFSENWLESAGEILAEDADFPYCLTDASPPARGEARGLVVTSSPSAGKATRARILFQLLLAAARKTILIQSPYFLPDRGVMRELANAVRRGVDVVVIMPGRHNNHPIARRASRRRYGELLRSGIRLLEYQTRMMHAKILMIDGVWSVVGSTNFDHRSFGLNDEVNLAVQDTALAAQLERHFVSDLHHCEEVQASRWSRSPGERLLAVLERLLERQA